jgi:glycosyltransferase involved in cell wall biosynthesis
MPKILVIVAAKNAVPWLPQCVASIARQQLPTCWDLGIAVGVDACQPTLAAVTQLNMPRMVVRFFPEHVGPYVIFNSLAHSAKSDVFVRFDSDDIMLPGYLREQLRVIEAQRGSSIVQTWSIYVDPDLRPAAALLADGTRTLSDGRRSRPSDGQMLMTRSVLDRLGGFRSWLCHADSEFMERAKWSGIAMKAIPQYLYLRRVHSLSLTVSTATSYRSKLRREYASQITHARRRYANGSPVERISPAVARYVPVGGM